MPNDISFLNPASWQQLSNATTLELTSAPEITPFVSSRAGAPSRLFQTIDCVIAQQTAIRTNTEFLFGRPWPMVRFFENPFPLNAGPTDPLRATTGLVRPPLPYFFEEPFPENSPFPRLLEQLHNPQTPNRSDLLTTFLTESSKRSRQIIDRINRGTALVQLIRTLETMDPTDPIVHDAVTRLRALNLPTNFIHDIENTHLVGAGMPGNRMAALIHLTALGNTSARDRLNEIDYGRLVSRTMRDPRFIEVAMQIHAAARLRVAAAVEAMKLIDLTQVQLNYPQAPERTAHVYQGAIAIAHYQIVHELEVGIPAEDFLKSLNLNDIEGGFIIDHWPEQILHWLATEHENPSAIRILRERQNAQQRNQLGRTVQERLAGLTPQNAGEVVRRTIQEVHQSQRNRLRESEVSTIVLDAARGLNRPELTPVLRELHRELGTDPLLVAVQGQSPEDIARTFHETWRELYAAYIGDERIPEVVPLHVRQRDLRIPATFDLANTPYDDLPREWKELSLRFAEAIISLHEGAANPVEIPGQLRRAYAFYPLSMSINNLDGLYVRFRMRQDRHRGLEPLRLEAANVLDVVMNIDINEVRRLARQLSTQQENTDNLGLAEDITDMRMSIRVAEQMIYYTRCYMNRDPELTQVDRFVQELYVRLARHRETPFHEAPYHQQRAYYIRAGKLLLGPLSREPETDEERRLRLRQIENVRRLFPAETTIGGQFTALEAQFSSTARSYETPLPPGAVAIPLTTPITGASADPSRTPESLLRRPREVPTDPSPVRAHRGVRIIESEDFFDFDPFDPLGIGLDPLRGRR